MKDKKKVVVVTPELATSGQIARLGLSIVNGVINLVDGRLSKDQVKMIKESELEEISSKIASEILGIIQNPWKEEIEKIKRFYKICFGIDVDFSNVSLPEKVEGFDRLDLVLSELTEDDVFHAYVKKFGKGSVSKHYENIRKTITEQQTRPDSDYAYRHRGGIKPDREHLNKSYNDFCQDGNFYMIPKEGIISAFRYRFETGEMGEVEGVTRFHALDYDGDTIHMCRLNGLFYVGRDNRDGCNFISGPRQIRF